jgi:hypothetical protein
LESEIGFDRCTFLTEDPSANDLGTSRCKLVPVQKGTIWKTRLVSTGRDGPFVFQGTRFISRGADVGEDAPRNFQSEQPYAHLPQLLEALGFWVVLHFLEVDFASGGGLEAL